MSHNVSQACRSSLILCGLVAGTGIAAEGQSPKIRPVPETAAEAVEETIHGVKIVDPYRWLEDQKSPATREWIDRQNAHTEEIVRKFSGREAITRRLGELMKVDSVSLPRARGNRYF